MTRALMANIERASEAYPRGSTRSAGRSERARALIRIAKELKDVEPAKRSNLLSRMGVGQISLMLLVTYESVLVSRFDNNRLTDTIMESLSVRKASVVVKSMCRENSDAIKEMFQNPFLSNETLASVLIHLDEYSSSVVDQIYDMIHGTAANRIGRHLTGEAGIHWPKKIAKLTDTSFCVKNEWFPLSTNPGFGPYSEICEK